MTIQDTYNDPIIYRMRKGSADDSFVRIQQTDKVRNNIILLKEIPDRFSGISISDGTNTLSTIDNGLPDSNKVVVDWTNGVLTFHDINNGKIYDISYYGKGNIYLPSSKVATQTDENGNVTETLKSLTDDARLAKDDASTQATYAKSQGDYAKGIRDNFGHKGNYSPTVAYKNGNVVAYGGTNYICIQDTTSGIDPLNGTYWTVVSPQATINKQTWTATEGQTVFTITNGNFVANQGNIIELLVGGVPQVSGVGFTETDNTTITLSEGVPAGTTVFAKWFEGSMSITKGHKSSHEQGGQDELDITKLKNFQEQVASPLAEKAQQTDLQTTINQLNYTLFQTVQNKFKFYPTPRLMVNPPTIVLGANGAASTITSSKLVNSTVGGQTYLNTQFTYPNGDVKRADWNGTGYSASYPDYGYVKNVAVTTTNSFGNLTVEFTFDGSELELVEKGQGGRYRIQVDEGLGYQLVTELTQAAAPSDGGQYLRKVTFQSRMTRRIKIEYAGVYFGGVYIGSSDNVTAVTRPLGKKAIFLGDSFTEGTGGDTAFNSYSPITANLLGWECWSSGSGATGYINPGTTGRVKFQDRVQHDVIGYNPDVVVVEGGTNDTTFDQTQLRSAVDQLLNTLKTGLPNAKIYVLSNFAVQGITTNISNTRDTIKASALANGLPFIDSIDGKSYDKNGNLVNITTGSWITGTGNINSIQQSGNASYYTWSDNGHPSLAGHRYIGERLAGELLRVAY